MVKNKKIRQEDNLQEVESALTKTEQFIEENQKLFSIIIGVAVAIVIIYLGFGKFYLQPREKEAKEQMFMAEHYFQTDSFNLAINGDGNYLGFLDIIDNYGMTKSANLAKYYTGISYLKLGEFEQAVEYLDKFDTDDMLIGPVAEGAKGDAYLELGKTDKALDQYKKAYQLSENELTAPVYMMKAAAVFESMEKYGDALNIYNELKKKYPDSNEGRNIEKYIARTKINLDK
ncbi:MAG: tetratricopeptide repeat protein [Prolixibacteraceae bacterium]|jgi:tetratricopeptide (TPR) repeat protein|nr:tetratricopeptide repeat protein [Prolixibacteraceae bacterium]